MKLNYSITVAVLLAATPSTLADPKKVSSYHIVSEHALETASDNTRQKGTARPRPSTEPQLPLVQTTKSTTAKEAIITVVLDESLAWTTIHTAVSALQKSTLQRQHR